MKIAAQYMLAMVAALAGAATSSPVFAQTNHATAFVEWSYGEVVANCCYDEGAQAASAQVRSDDPDWFVLTDPLLQSAALAGENEAGQVILQVFASAQGTPDTVAGGFAGARATWHDRLSYLNPDNALQHAYLIFKPYVTGSITGNASAYFNASLAVGERYDEQLFTFTTPGGHEDFALFKVPLFDLIDLDIEDEFDTTADLFMELTASAGGNGEADFSHTAGIGPIYIGDINGSPIPGWEQIQIVGESGIVYQTRAIPEPSTAILLAMGLVIWCSRGALRTRPNYSSDINPPA